MNKFFMLALIFAMISTSCGSYTILPASPTGTTVPTEVPTSTPTASLTPTTAVPTETAIPSPTVRPTPTPSPTRKPTPTLKPISPETARNLTEWQQIGNGYINSISWSPGKTKLMVYTSSDTFQYKADTLGVLSPYQPPQLPGSIGSPAFSSDGRIAAYIQLLSNSYVIQLRDMTANRNIKQIGNYKAEPQRMVFSPNGKILAVQTVNISVYQTDIWDIENGKHLWTLGGLIGEPCFSMDGNIFVYWVYGGAYGSQVLAIVLWNLKTGGSIYTIHPGGSGDLGLDISPDNTLLALHKIDEVVLINIQTGSYHRIMKQNLSKYGSVGVVKFSPDGKTLASTNSEEGSLRLWDVQSGTEIKSIEGVGWVEKLLFTPDGKRLVTAGDQIQLWDIDEGVRFSVVYGFVPIYEAFFIPNNKIILTYLNYVNSFHEPMVWDINNRMVVPVNFPHGVPLAISPDGKLISFAIRDFEKGIERISLYSVDNGELVLQLEGEYKCDSDSGVALEAAFSSDGNLFSVGCPIKSAVGNNIFLWDLRTGGYLKFWHAEASIVFDQEGSILITYSRRTMKFWDVSTGNLITELYASDNIRQVEFSPDNKILAADYRSGIQFWELSSFKPLFHVSGTIDDYTFNPDWSKLAVVEYHWQNGQVNRTLKIYDMSTQQVFYSIQGGYTKTASAAQLISSPDGKIIVMKNFKSDSFDIMDFNSGAQLSRIQVPSWFYVPPYFTFNPDGRILAIPGYGSTVSLYAIKPSGP